MANIRFYFCSMIPEYLIYICYLIIGVFALFNLYFYARIFFWKKPNQAKEYPPVSVLIAARYEEENLKKYLPTILEQDYPNYEVIVINDRSEDDTENVLLRIQKKYKHLRIVNIPENKFPFPGKKYALSTGIKVATHDHLLFTDADCQPQSKQWIKSMMDSFQYPNNIVLGIGLYTPKNTLLSFIHRFDGFRIAHQYSAFALAGFPYMAVGRNLAYHKDVFFKHKGFSSHINIPSGDDDIFINQAAKPSSTTVNFSPHALTFSSSPTSFLAWVKQKRRHLSSSIRYNKRNKAILAINQVLNLTALIVFFIGIYLKQPIVFYSILAAYLFKIISGLVFSNKLGQIKKYWYYILLWPILEIFLEVFIGFLFILNKFTQQAGWK